jgi:ribosomal protein L35
MFPSSLLSIFNFKPIMARMVAASSPQLPHPPHILLLNRFMGIKRNLKANTSAGKRFRVKGNGSLKRNKAGMSHNTGHKSSGRKSRLSSSGPIVEKKIEQNMKKLIGSTK